ncbi:MAG: 2-oxoacid:acceptor oxidoreductase family protein [Nitrospinae bacterium]|nr:2-oxoacid:acceptor oxidoreductase family protein [Nitrospinota bacterium]
MLRIRLHGRGGQGIKTASQILGSAAFYSGFQAQDFPLYGAERRGAPIVAFTRISENPILERGPIAIPDMLLIGDETLLEGSQAAPICGADEATSIFINSAKSPEELQKQFAFFQPPFQLNLTELCIQYLNHGMLLSTALAAAGAQLTGIIEMQELLKAVDAELSILEIQKEVLQKNLDLAKAVFQGLAPATFFSRSDTDLQPSPLINMSQKNVSEAAPLIFSMGNMALRKTGDWRVQRPEIDYSQCNKCLICYARCPDGAIHLDADERPEIDYDHCKGCMICAQECPGHFINTVREAGVGL